MFQQITILGPGLLGASLAMAVKERGLAARVVTWSRRPETRAKCLNHSWCDTVLETPEQAVAGSDLVVICTPVQTIVPLLAQIRPALTESALVTEEVIAGIEKNQELRRFITRQTSRAFEPR